MLKLDLNPQPRWIELLPGVSVQVRPPSSTIVQTGLMALRDAETGDGAAGEIPEVAATREVRMAKAVAGAAILAWTGVVGPDGKPAPVDAVHVGALIDHYPACRAFLARYVNPAFDGQALQAAEGEGSGAAPDGTMAAAPSIADSAAPAAPTVEDGAPMKKIGRKASQD